MPLRRSQTLVNQQNGYFINAAANGDFDSDPNIEWTAVDSTLASVSGGQSGNALQITITGGILGSAYQDIVTQIGRLYEFRVLVKKGTSSASMFSIGDSGDSAAVYQSDLYINTEWEEKVFLFYAVSELTRISLAASGVGVGATALFDSLVFNDVTSNLADLLKGAKLYVFSGAQTASPNLGAADDLLCVVSNGENGLTVTATSAATVIKNQLENWSGQIISTGVAKWFRFAHDNDDVTLDNDTTVRLDGDVGTLPDFNLRLAGTTLVVGAPDLSIRTFTYTVNYNGD